METSAMRALDAARKAEEAERKAAEEWEYQEYLKTCAETKTFSVVSGSVHITDPCYSVRPSTWCGIYNQVALNGTWEARVTLSDQGTWGVRVATLTANHADYSPGSGWIRLEGSVGVDSGQAGVFDAAHYAPDTDTFYKEACACTDHGFGTLQHGVVSRTGDGDGAYVAYGQYRDGALVAVKIDYYPEGDD